MRSRLIFSIVSSIIEEAVIAAIVLWGLPRWNIQIPLWGLVLVMAAWAAFSVFTHRAGSRALRMKQMVGLHNMIGCTGEVVSPLAPEGMVRIKGELWRARSDGSEMKEGCEIIVVGQDRLELIVQDASGTETLNRGT